MLHPEVYKIYRRMFKEPTVGVTTWWPNGYNSVRIREPGSEVVFTYTNDKEWRLESIEQHIRSIEEKTRTRKETKSNTNKQD